MRDTRLMNRLLAPVFLALGLVAAMQGMAQGDDVVWVWNRNCPRPTRVGLRVRLDGKDVYRTSLRLCRWDRRFENGKGSFRLAPPRPLVWSDYRSERDVTPAGAPLDFDFWQAGGEADLVLLGYSVLARDGIHMNSLHFLSPTEKRTLAMAPGLILETWPETKP